MMKSLNTELKLAREKSGLLVREAAHKLGVDAALVSRYEGGSRLPSKKTLHAMAHLYGMDESKFNILWLSHKILEELEGEEDGLAALQFAEEQIRYRVKTKRQAIDKSIKVLLKEIDSLKKELQAFRKYDSYRIAEALELEYTYESNRIEGNTLDLKETDLVINEGLTISGKSMREHLEAVNHKEAIAFIRELVNKKSILNERNLLSIHNLVLRGIDPENAGSYRKIQVMIKGSRHIPPQPFMVSKAMEEYFTWYHYHKKTMHPVLLAAEMHERLVTIHPFIDGNGRTARLVMNLILLQHGFVIANIKGDAKTRISYYDALEKAQADEIKTPFLEFIAQVEISSLKRYLGIIKMK
jgi:Fic family protein